MNPKTLLWPRVTSWHPMDWVEKKRGGLWLSVHAWMLGGGWLYPTSRSLTLPVLGLTKRFLELRSHLLILLLSTLTGGFWMVYAHLSSPQHLRGYLVLTAWYFFCFRSLNEDDAMYEKVFCHSFTLDVMMSWIILSIFFFVCNRAERV